MISERQLISQIGGIARRSGSVEEAVALIESFLSKEIGSVMLLLRPVDGTHLNESAVARFLESHEFPFRGVYTAPVVADGESRATVVACFGTWGAPGELFGRATASIARDLGTLVGRLHPGGVAA